jgi:subtilase family serine protease
MRRIRVGLALISAALLAAVLAPAASAGVVEPQMIAAHLTPGAPPAGTTPACVSPAPVMTSQDLHCYTPAQVRAAYDVNGVAPLPGGSANDGQGQTIVLVDAYGSPTMAGDLQFFHDAFFKSLPNPDFDEVYPQGAPNYGNYKSQGQSGPNGAAGWAGEAELDVEWSYAIAPRAHIVLLAVPPSETEGVQGIPNLMKAIQSAINTYPSGTVFSMSWGITEQTLGGHSAFSQTSKWDQTFANGIAKGDTFLSASGDNGTTGTAKQHKETATFGTPTNGGWPGSSPLVTAVGGTQLQYGWTWDPTSDVPFNADGSDNPGYWNSTPGGNTQAVWNETWLPAASSGGPSVIYSLPSWQSGVASVVGSNARGIPDLAWNASVNGGVLQYQTAYPTAEFPAGWQISGGTSAASPQVAGVIALANAARSAAGKAPIGDLNPILYSLPSSDYRDVTPVTEGTAASGVLDNNQLWQYNADGSVSPGPVAGFPTLTGWDMTTGFGSPVVSPFVASLTALP